MADTMSKKESDLVSRLLKQFITTVCRETFTFKNSVEVDAMISITLDENANHFIKFHKKIVNGKPKDSEKVPRDSQTSKIECKPKEEQNDVLLSAIKTEPGTEEYDQQSQHVKIPKSKIPEIGTGEISHAATACREPVYANSPVKSENIDCEREGNLSTRIYHEKQLGKCEQKTKSNHSVEQFQNIRNAEGKGERPHANGEIMTKHQTDLDQGNAKSEQTYDNKRSASYGQSLQGKEDRTRKEMSSLKSCLIFPPNSKMPQEKCENEKQISSGFSQLNKQLVTDKEITKSMTLNADQRHPEVTSGHNISKVKQNPQMQTSKDKPIDMSIQIKNGKQISNELNMKPGKKDLKRVHQIGNTENSSKAFEAHTQLDVRASVYEEKTKLDEDTVSSVKRPKVYSEETLGDSRDGHKMMSTANVLGKTVSKRVTLTNEEMQITEKAMQSMAAFQSEVRKQGINMPGTSGARLVKHDTGRSADNAAFKGVQKQCSSKKETMFCKRSWFSCDICKTVHRSFSDFDSHTQRTHQKYICQDCGKQLASPLNREKHYQTHLGKTVQEESMPFKCKICMATFNYEAFLEHHISVSHSSH